MVYINGAASVSAQQWTEASNFNSEVIVYNQTYIKALKPKYKDFIKPMEVRRMSKTVKNSIVASSLALRQAKCEMPQAIIVGTGQGVVTDTQKFLEKLLDDKEKFLTPTAFIQSTHNTPAATIAARLKCHAYNYSYINRGHSFDNALQDALMHIAEGKTDILVGGSDEMTEQYFGIMRKGGWWKQNNLEGETVFNSTTKGAFCGEGSHFFLLSSEKNQTTQSELVDIHTFSGEKTPKNIKDELNSFLQKNKLQLSDVDMVLQGYSGDSESDSLYHNLSKTIFSQLPVGGYKHLSGEHSTASAFALWLANAILVSNTKPDFLLINNHNVDEVNNILIYNSYFNINHSFLLLKSV